jgi:hypothetical protein
VDIQTMQTQRDQLDEQIKTAKATARREKFELARAAETAAHEAHYARMFDEIGRPLAGLNEDQHAIVYSQAWEHGHASGYSEVENYYGDLAEMARKLIAAK